MDKDSRPKHKSKSKYVCKYLLPVWWHFNIWDHLTLQVDACVHSYNSKLLMNADPFLSKNRDTFRSEAQYNSLSSWTHSPIGRTRFSINKILLGPSITRYNCMDYCPDCTQQSQKIKSTNSCHEGLWKLITERVSS